MDAVTHWLLLTSQVLVFMLALPATAFPIVYGLFFHWRKYDAGKTVMAATVALSALVDMTIVLRVVDPPLFVQALVSVLVLLMVLAASVFKLTVLLRKLFQQGCIREEDAKR